MESKVSEILETVLSMLSLEGSFEVEEKNEGVFVSIEASDPGRLIGHQGQTLSSLQLLINQIISRQIPDSKRVIIDVSGWKQSKEEELVQKTKEWIKQVLEEGKPMELLPMPAWQRRIVHMTVQESEGVESESIGEGLERHLVISPEKSKDSKSTTRKSKKKTEKSEAD